MKTVLVIGGMGSGKSTVAHLFTDWGVPVLDLDRVGHEVLGMLEVKKHLAEAFGNDIFTTDENINRKALAQRAFASSSATQKLTEITAPFIRIRMNEWLLLKEAEDFPFVIVEVSAFDGTQGFYAGIADAIVAVVAPVELRKKRAAKRGFSTADIEKRIAQQPSDEERQKWAQYVISNEGTEEDLHRQVEEIYKSLMHSL